MSAEKAFAYMADLRRFAEWDPGVRRVVQVEGEGGGPEAVFDLTVATLGPDLTLRYETTEYDAPRSFRVVAKSAWFTSDDRIRVETKRGKTIVTYDAELRLNGLLGLFDPGLRLVFGWTATARRRACARHWAASSVTFRIADAVDALLEAPVAPSFTRIGYDIRSVLEHWKPLASYDLRGRVMLLTGATSGLGLAAAEALAHAGATLILLGRDAAKTERVRADLARRTDNDRLSTLIADMGDLDAVRRAAGEVLASHGALHVLAHNAGALHATRRTAPGGTEETVASQVLGPFLLTGLLMARGSGAGARAHDVVGRMYATGLAVEHLGNGRRLQRYRTVRARQAGAGDPERDVGRALRHERRGLPCDASRLGPDAGRRDVAADVPARRGSAVAHTGAGGRHARVARRG
jgi:hypothetical protein